jgi:CRP-like cAMP-binding protein
METRTIETYLSEDPFFSGLDPEDLAFLAGHAATQRLENDEILFNYGEPAKRFYVIRRGQLSVEVAAIQGPALELQRLGPGAVVGWSWLIPPYQWSFQARARVPTEVLAFDGKAVLERCERDPRFGYALLKRFSGLMSERLHFARRKMMDEWNPPGFA